MLSNIRHHRISWRPLLLWGAVAGVLSALVSGAIMMFAGPLVDSSLDMWSFPKVVATIVMGTAAAEPISGFELLPVALGLALHFAIGALFGAVFALLVSFFDLEGTLPVMLAGLIYGVVVFTGTYLGLAGLMFPAFEELPIMVAFYNHLAFGFIAGLLLADWAPRFDSDFAESELYGDEFSERALRRHHARTH